MEFGCSQCLAAAIESHQPVTLVNFLDRPVVYRDIFWAPMPSYNVLENARGEKGCSVLHHISAFSDLSFVWKNDCGHVNFDVEINESIPLKAADRILVSLPLLARWHSSSQFDAEQMLRDCWKFDFTEPQFFHNFTSDRLELQFEIERPSLKSVMLPVPDPILRH